MADPNTSTSTGANTGSSNGGDDASRADQLRREAAKAADAARTAATGAINEIKVAGSQLVDRVRDLIEEGNVRRIVIRRGDKTLLEIPLTVGVGAGAAAVLVSPVLAALGAFAALVSEITIVVEREDAAEESAPSSAEKTVGRRNSGDEAK
jgi:hypothetical protein